MTSVSHRRIQGFTLIELMISLVLGLIVIGGATSVIISNRQTYRTNEAMSQVQESARTAFELLARSIREAGVTGCDSSSGRVANVLPYNTVWWQNWFVMAGFEGTQANGDVPISTVVGERVSGTDSLLLQGIQGVAQSIAVHQPATPSIRLNTPAVGFVNNDVLVACDFDHASMFAINFYTPTTLTMTYTAPGGSATALPNLCSTGLGYPSQPGRVSGQTCGVIGNVYTFSPNSQVARLSAVDWYIGNNGRTAEGGRSLYRRRLAPGGTLVTEEVVSGVVDMQLKYRLQTSTTFDDATPTTVWSNVNAVRIELTLQSADQRVTTSTTVNSGRLSRTFINIIAMRNRVQ